MFTIEYYQTASGRCKIQEWLDSLAKKRDSEYKTVLRYFQRLKEYGVKIGEPTVKRLSGTILWELRPKDNRVLFITLRGNHILCLHQFVKKTNEIPQHEIDKALANYKDYCERNPNE